MKSARVQEGSRRAAEFAENNYSAFAAPLGGPSCVRPLHCNFSGGINERANHSIFA
jgi:hypothetical protein